MGFATEFTRGLLNPYSANMNMLQWDILVPGTMTGKGQLFIAWLLQ